MFYTKGSTSANNDITMIIGADDLCRTLHHELFVNDNLEIQSLVILTKPFIMLLLFFSASIPFS